MVSPVSRDKLNTKMSSSPSRSACTSPAPRESTRRRSLRAMRQAAFNILPPRCGRFIPGGGTTVADGPVLNGDDPVGALGVPGYVMGDPDDPRAPISGCGDLPVQDGEGTHIKPGARFVEQEQWGRLEEDAARFSRCAIPREKVPAVLRGGQFIPNFPPVNTQKNFHCLLPKNRGGCQNVHIPLIVLQSM